MNVGFDLDGVLLDSAGDLAWLDRGLDDALDDLGIEQTSANRQQLYPDALADLEAVADRFEVDPDRLWAVRTRHYTQAKIEAIRTGEIGAYDDLDALDGIADATLFCVSNSPQAVVEAFFEQIDRRDEFAVLVGRGQSRAALDRLKPDPAMFEPVAESLDGNEYVYVGDRESDRSFAGRTGMDYVHLDRRERTLSDAIAAVRDCLESRSGGHPT